MFNLLCKHDWKLIDKVETKSELELIVGLKNLTSLKNASNDKLIIQIVACGKCGKLKTFKTFI